MRRSGRSSSRPAASSRSNGRSLLPQGEKGERAGSCIRFGADFAGVLATTGPMRLPLIRLCPGFRRARAAASAPPTAAIGRSVASRNRRRDGAGGFAAGDRRISPQAEGISGSARGVRAGGRRLLDFDLGETARPQRQAAERQTITLDDYVLTQPPVYAGPKRPVNPEPEARRRRRASASRIPVVADLLKAAAEHFQFTPQRPATEVEFKRAYARTRWRPG